MARIVGTNGNDSLVGTSSADSIEGLAGNDTLVGLGSSDTLLGGTGDDLYVVSSGDVLSDSGGVETVQSTVSWTLGTGFENLIFTGTAATSGSGNDLDNVMTGNSAGNWMRGRGGDDTLIGGGGNDTFNMRHGASGTYGNDFIDGGSGVDTLDYGATATTAVVINLAAGTASGGGNGGSGSATLVSIENANGSAFDDVMNGSAAANFLFGFNGNDTLNGADGNDRLEGGAGNDSLNGGAGSDTLLGGESFSSSTPQVLDGGPGADSMSGGAGGDVYFVDDPGDSFSDTGGHDAIFTTISLVAPSWVEQLTLMGSANANITGNDLANNLHGNSGANWIVGQAGNDFLMGGLQNDTLTGGTGSDQFYFGVAPGGADADTLTDFAPGADKVLLDGNFHANVGPSGNFATGDGRFFAGSGASSAQDASDRVIYDTSSGRLWYDADGLGGQAAQLIATLQGAPAITAADISVLNGSGGNGTEQGQAINGTPGNDSLVGTFGDDTINGFGGNDTLAGSEGADLLVGGEGNDTLDAGQSHTGGDDAADTLSGGLGDDLYFVSSDGDMILADPGGVDTVRARNTDWTLGAGLENLFMVDDGSAFHATGNELNNHIIGASEGGQLFGMGGDDSLVMNNVQNFSSAYGGDGNDTIRGGRSTELFGDAGNDVLVHGDAGADMTGGSGSDRFTFEEAGSFARIRDFASGTDEIVLDATSMGALGTSGNFAPTDERFHAGATAAEGDDRVIWNASTGQLWYDADGSGSGAALEIATLQAGAALIAADIEVINGSAPPPPPSGGQTVSGTSAPETLTGGTGNDTISGGAGSDRLFGLDGNDSLLGGTEADNMFGDNGNDWLDGDAGQDRVTGGAGADSFVYNDALASANLDYINDFVSGTDKILLDNAVMTALGADGMLAAGRFVAAPNARSGLDADDRLMYDTVSGKLYYDADGSGAAGQSVIAVLTGAPTLAVSDIVVI